ncbi:DUF3750 domain-containing protein [Telmatospirillum sp. J64-1]|uniref:DUF3750 domain-containing protein n=1 Tax=Telmatospirillum sp. J64-1 TaxID=2502183 RepID=UPI00115F3B22|nr:DUF3750 domain-containing protein [Telmatospirillum sp. J64-1]
MKVMLWLLAILGVLLAGPAAVLALGTAKVKGDWSTATHEPTGQAPSPETTPEAVVQVYAARTFGWRGAFAVHSWVAAKPAGADRYTRYEVIGWNLFRGLSAVTVSSLRAPDAQWYGQTPMLLGELRGEVAQRVAEKLPEAARSYPWPDRYRAWPGPNSNTFLAHLGREIPELMLDLPAHALGKDWLPTGQILARAPSGTGWQISFWGIAGILLARQEGLEINLLGLVFGIDPAHLSLKVPGFGRIPQSAIGDSVKDPTR